MITAEAAKSRTYDMVYIAVFAVLMAICSWISIPTAVPFTLQTFAVFLAVGVLGGKRGTTAVLLFVLMGAIGIPVFSGFTGGLGIILGSTGGYIVGFILSGLIMWGMERLLGRKNWVLLISMLLGLVVCYLFGSLWFMAVYAKSSGGIGFAAVLSWCVFPFIVPDIIKIGLAVTLSKRLSKAIGLR